MACEKHGYTNNVLCPACDLETIERETKTNNRFFIVIRGNRGRLMTLEDDNRLATWPTAEAARDAVRNHPLVRAYGGEIHGYGSEEIEQL